MKIPTLPQLSALMISILSGDSSEILVLRATYLHLENISQIIEKQKGKYLPLALLIRILRFLVMMIFAPSFLGSLSTDCQKKKGYPRDS